MRRILVLALAAVAFAVAMPASASQSPDVRQRFRHADRAQAAATAAADAFIRNDAFFTLTFNHLGKPSLGAVVAETWGEVGFDVEGNHQTTQGVTRAFLLPRAVRVAARVTLFGQTTPEAAPDLLTASSTVNSSGARLVQVATPEVPNMASDPHCLFFTAVNMAIRWDDNRLSNVAFEQDAFFFNLANPACFEAAAAK